MIKIKDIKTALLEFERAAIKHAEATESGDYKIGNKNYAMMKKAVTFLKAHNSVDKLSLFLEHDSVGVQIWAATHLLPIHEDQALRVLNQIFLQNGIYALSAEMTISEWKKGKLNL